MVLNPSKNGTVWVDTNSATGIINLMSEEVNRYSNYFYEEDEMSKHRQLRAEFIHSFVTTHMATCAALQAMDVARWKSTLEQQVGSASRDANMAWDAIIKASEEGGVS